MKGTNRLLTGYEARAAVCAPGHGTVMTLLMAPSKAACRKAAKIARRQCEEKYSTSAHHQSLLYHWATGPTVVHICPTSLHFLQPPVTFIQSGRCRSRGMVFCPAVSCAAAATAATLLCDGNHQYTSMLLPLLLQEQECPWPPSAP